jgi:hypothetical protein
MKTPKGMKGSVRIFREYTAKLKDDKIPKVPKIRKVRQKLKGRIEHNW